MDAAMSSSLHLSIFFASVASMLLLASNEENLSSWKIMEMFVGREALSTHLKAFTFLER